MKLVIFSLVLFILGIYMFIQQQEQKIIDQNMTIPAIVIPHKSIEFKIEKKRDTLISFIGKFSDEASVKKIIHLLMSKKIVHNITINAELEYNPELFILINKILPIIQKDYTVWLLRYYDKKLLIDGETTSKESRDRIDFLLEYSTINSFNNTKIKTIVSLDEEESKIVKELEELVISKKEIKSGNLSEDEVNSILSSLKEVIVIEKKDRDREEVVPKKEIPKVKSFDTKKKKISSNLLLPENKPIEQVEEEIFDEEKTLDEFQDISEEEYYQSILKENIPEEDIMSLPMVEIVDMDIEEKIAKGILSPLRTKKPLREEVIIEPIVEELDNSIPWAKLHDKNEKLEGEISDEIVASPIF